MKSICFAMYVIVFTTVTVRRNVALYLRSVVAGNLQPPGICALRISATFLQLDNSIWNSILSIRRIYKADQTNVTIMRARNKSAN